MAVEAKAVAMAQKLAARRVAYREQMPARFVAIRDAWEALQRGTGDPTEVFYELIRQVHNISGSAGTFGLGPVGEKARALEQFLVGLDSKVGGASGEATDEFERGFAQLKALFDATPSELLPNTVPTIDGAPPDGGAAARIYIVEDDPVQGREIAEQLQAFGWETTVFADSASMERALLGRCDPAAFVIDMALPEGMLAGGPLMRRIAESLGRHVPQIVISAHWDWSSRLEAVRAGAAAYMVKPIDFGLLAERLDAVTRRQVEAPVRVLIVDDTRLLAEHFAQVLTDAGMHANVLSDPTRILDALVEFDADVILMDLFMPGCTGIEAARVIRQDPKFTTVPILFLSTETSRQARLEAIAIGADDFMHKPIADTDLILAVTARARRFRALSSLVRQDSLTGLLNHISLKLQLESEIERCRRSGTSLAFVMLDLDHFKQVNDTYGHPVGDQVIRTISQLLRSRLRKSDVVGRYGGEEFAVLMPDTGIGGATAIVESLREQFASIGMVGGQTHFHCTFSAGIAVVPPATSMDALIQAADVALYEAKRTGRNRVCAAART